MKGLIATGRDRDGNLGYMAVIVERDDEEEILIQKLCWAFPGVFTIGKAQSVEREFVGHNPFPKSGDDEEMEVNE